MEIETAQDQPPTANDQVTEVTNNNGIMTKKIPNYPVSTQLSASSDFRLHDLFFRSFL
jgi:hypothetical protein